MRSWLYVQVHVEPADPERVNLMHGLAEKTGGPPVPDVIPHTDPGAITFRAAFVLAPTPEDAYTEALSVPFPELPGVMNDWVVPAMPPNKRIKFNKVLTEEDFQ